MRRLLRWGVGPAGRRLGLALVVASAWLWWAFGPALPRTVLELTDHETVTSFGTSDDGALLVSQGSEPVRTSRSSAISYASGPLRVWDLTTGRERCSVLDRDAPTQGFMLAPGRAWMAVVEPGGALSVWDTATGRRLADLPLIPMPSGPWIATHRRGLAIVRADGRAILVWDMDAGRVTATLEGARPPLTFSPDGRTLATGWDGPTVRLWDAATGAPGATLDGFPGLIEELAFAPDGRTLAVVAERPCLSPEIGPAPMPYYDVTLWDGRTGQARAIIRGNQRPYSPFPRFSPDGRFLVLHGYAGTGLVWDLSTLPPRARDDLLTDLGSYPMQWKPTPGCISFRYPLSGRFPVFAPDGRTLAVAAAETADTLRLLDAATGTERAVCRLADLRDRHLDSVTFAPDGRTLAVSLLYVAPGRPATFRNWVDRILRRPGTDAMWTQVQLFDTATGRELARVGKSDRANFAPWFSPDGRSLWTLDYRGRLTEPVYGNCLALRWAVPSGDEVGWPAGLTALALLLAAADYRRQRRRASGIVTAS